MTDYKHKVTVSNVAGYKTEITGRGHTLISDEPIESNGTDTGMSPYELLLASVGACKAITMRMYAERKGLQLDNVKLELYHAKVPAEECSTVETESGKVDKFVIKVDIRGNLTEEQRARIIEIGDRCPVQRTLLSDVELVSGES